MTDKQIIIDGIDVSGCEYYDKNKSLLTCTCEEYACSECHNCYYKQLKRKEQECEELKKTSCKFKNYCTCDTEKLKQTLTEIKEIAEKQCVCGVNCIDMKQILQKIIECEVNDEM